MFIKTADLCDREGTAARVCVGPWRSFGGRAAVSGTVATLRTREDVALLRKHLGTAGEGRILVVDAGGSLRAAVLGDNMARIGMQNGWAGVLIHGAIRDAAELGTLDLGVFALGSVPMRGASEGVGEWGVDVSFGGATIRPGEFMAMDPDGVVVVAAPASR